MLLGMFLGTFAYLLIVIVLVAMGFLLMGFLHNSTQKPVPVSTQTPSPALGKQYLHIFSVWALIINIALLAGECLYSLEWLLYNPGEASNHISHGGEHYLQWSDGAAVLLFPALLLLFLAILVGHRCVQAYQQDEEALSLQKKIAAFFGLIILACLCFLAPGGPLFGPVSVYQVLSLFFNVMLCASVALCYYLQRHPEYYLYLPTPLCGFVAFLLCSVAITLPRGWLIYSSPPALANVLVKVATGKLAPTDFFTFTDEQANTCILVSTVISYGAAIPLLVLGGYMSWLTFLAYQKAKFLPKQSDISGGNTMKIFKNGSWVERDEAMSKDQALMPLESHTELMRPFDINNDNVSITDRIKSKYTSIIKGRIMEDQAKVTESQTKVIEAQAKALEAQKKAMEQKVGIIKTVTEGKRAQNEMELLPEERRVQEMSFDLNKTELELEKLKLEVELQKLKQKLQDPSVDSPEIAVIKEVRQQNAKEKRQVYMAETEHDSITARMQALDDWYEEKQTEIMGNGKLEAARRRQQLDVLDMEYRLRKKEFDDFINAKLAAMDDQLLEI